MQTTDCHFREEGQGREVKWVRGQLHSNMEAGLQVVGMA